MCSKYVALEFLIATKNEMGICRGKINSELWKLLVFSSHEPYNVTHQFEISLYCFKLSILDLVEAIDLLHFQFSISCHVHICW